MRPFAPTPAPFLILFGLGLMLGWVARAETEPTTADGLLMLHKPDEFTRRFLLRAEFSYPIHAGTPVGNDLANRAPRYVASTLYAGLLAIEALNPSVAWRLAARLVSRARMEWVIGDPALRGLGFYGRTHVNGEHSQVVVRLGGEEALQLLESAHGLRLAELRALKHPRFQKFALAPTDSLSLDPAAIGANRDRWIDEWTTAVLR